MQAAINISFNLAEISINYDSPRHRQFEAAAAASLSNYTLNIMVIPYKGPKCSGNRFRYCKNENWPGQTSIRYFPSSARTSTAI